MSRSCGCVKGGPKVIDITGQRFGHLVALAFFGRNDGAMKSAWFCECDCGGCAFIEGSHLRRRYYKSCGQKCPFSASSEEKHGQCHADNRSGAWRSWQSMKQRCLNPNPDRREWKAYRGRGITVCERWLTFENFYADMGERPEGHSIDRIDVNGNYSCGHCDQCIEMGWPANCRWADPPTQAGNRRNSKPK